MNPKNSDKGITHQPLVSIAENVQVPGQSQGENISCCPAPADAPPPRTDQPFVIGTLETPAGAVPVVSSVLTLSDHWGTFKARLGVGRMRYTVDPGLYALGRPDDRSHVMVTASYKMSFDCLRRALPGRDAWILVLDTQGINVWCAAGKGTFGTDELVRRIQASGLSRVVSHRDLIIPQLGAAGVSAHQVKRRSGFRVIYGPVRAQDIPRFLEKGMKAAPDMRRKAFPLVERIVLIPVELVEALKIGLLAAPAFFLLGGLGGTGGFWENAFSHGLVAAFSLLTAILAGAVLVPILLPWLPGRAFSTKGFTLGFTSALVYVALGGCGAWAEAFGLVFLMSAVVAYLAMNFTGASTFTSLSGVKKEMRWAVPAEIATAVIGLGFWFGSRFTV
ncbi:MAG: acetyl-CoA synthase subunit gamma [Deltaproteobacteria bacterium]|nr:acetyl-CoA synthase subunit gamma [Deltaproteobacteria bacterium]MBW1924796.1 acetyl-CoA synthase subunit gamma [Deltaproteobacteria bacterium]MBW2010003.1 acetyl-CoA synthase subunit gamma [Deltaproteobacteria bacterium]MBW2104320.1 acetyl-CoA synthase subunit gamma [Deltaproteobacteria bacterium]